MTPQKYLVCSALPYANGPLHIGHLAGCYIPGDIYARARRLQGHEVLSICGTDEYGAAITIRAFQDKTTPQAVVDRYHNEIKTEFEQFNLSFDIFSRTSYPWHGTRAQEFFTHLYERGLIEKRVEKRLYCESCAQFLPDRYVVGECPTCHQPGARGDQCEKCGAWFEPEALIKPICQICKKNEAKLKETAHWYLLLDKLEPQLRQWLETKTSWRKNVLGYAYQPLKDGLTGRAISRDLSWGVPVPLDEAAGKVLYVWMDAPIGYISATEEWANKRGTPDAWKPWWEDKNTKLIHFIGKDNIVFHTIVWPALLMGDGRYVLPELVAGNEFLNLEGQKISTSRNFAVWAREALEFCPADIFRYYLTAISPETSDADFTWSDFQRVVNGELADIIGNLANRTLTFIEKNYGGVIAPEVPLVDPAIAQLIQETKREYEQQLEGGFSKSMLLAVSGLGRKLNQYMQEQAPWKVRKEDPAKAHQILCTLAEGIKAVAVLLSPICPTIAQEIWRQLGGTDRVEAGGIDRVTTPFAPGSKVGTGIKPVVQKIEDSQIAAAKAKL